MNVKLSFGPLSATPLDLLLVVLDPDQTLHALDDPAAQAAVERARAG